MLSGLSVSLWDNNKSVALVLKLTKQPLLLDEINGNFCG
jgi:hypothetical protein